MKNSINHTKKLISLAIYQLIYRYDYDDISVKDICDKAGVSRVSFYRYYSKKEDVFVDFCDERFEEFFNEYLKHPDITFREFALLLFTFFKKYRRQLSLLRKAHKDQLLMSQFNSYARYLVSSLKFTLYQPTRSNPMLAPFFAGGVFNVLITWLDEGMKQSPEELTEQLFSFLEGLQGKKQVV